MLAYVFLLADGVGPVSNAAWPLPGGEAPGGWLTAEEVVPISSRVQGCHAKDLPFWVSQALWVAEIDGDVTEHRCHVAGDRGRLLRRVEGWTPDASADFAAACGFRTREHVVALLRHDGFESEATRLAECPDLETITSVGADLAAGLSGRQRLFAARAGGNAIAARAPRTSITAHLTSVVAGEVLEAIGTVASYDDGFLQERAWQADWIADRLDLTDLQA